MKLQGRIAAAVFAGALLMAPAAVFAQYGYGPQGPPPPPGAWNSYPSDYTRDVQRNGFDAGIHGAEQDFKNHRPPNVLNRDEFRHYHGPERRVWRNAFQRGYSTWWSHQGGPGRGY